MIDINSVEKAFNNFIDKYDNQEDPGFNLKVVHTKYVVENAKFLAIKMNLSNEDISLAMLIAYLHDIGRFEELRVLKGFESVKNDHALVGSKMLFENNLIREFIEDNSYDEIIRKAIENHNKFQIEDGLDDRTLLHAKIIRDADKIDNYRVKKDENVEDLFPGKFSTIEEFNNSLISDKVYDSIKRRRCVDIHDRVYPLDYWLCVMAFLFDLNFKESFKVLKDNDYINVLINKLNITNPETKEKIEDIKNIMNDFIQGKINE